MTGERTRRAFGVGVGVDDDVPAQRSLALLEVGEDVVVGPPGRALGRLGVSLGVTTDVRHVVDARDPPSILPEGTIIRPSAASPAPPASAVYIESVSGLTWRASNRWHQLVG
jgi:hypothetical protein